jgi:hypothetical protein
MNTVETSRSTPQPLLSAGARLAAALAVAAVATAAWMGAQQASHEALRSAQIAFAPDSSRITLPSVVIVGHRDRALAATAPARRGV